MTAAEAFEAIGRGLASGLLGATATSSAPESVAVPPAAIDPAAIVRLVDERIAQLADEAPTSPEQLDLLTSPREEVPFEPSPAEAFVQARYAPDGSDGGDPLRWMQT